MFTKLLQEQLDKKISFVENYLNVVTPADGSVVDANANVSSRNIATLHAELNKDINVQVNRSLNFKYIEKHFGHATASEYLHQIASHEIYCNDESSLNPYCVAISLYPFLLNGLVGLDGESKAPKHIDSFCGGFVNLIFALSSQYAGAVAVAEFFLAFDYFCIKEYGNGYLSKANVRKKVENHLQHVIYALNQPASARNYQSVFFNVSVFDAYFFEGLFKNFVFPDGTKPEYRSVNRLQKFFLQWIRKERMRADLTFPVITATLLCNDNEPLDKPFANFLASELSEGNSFFIYQSPSVDSLSSCCRLRNKISDPNEFSYTLGAVGVMTGSIHVITLNFNRFVQNKFFAFTQNPENPKGKMTKAFFEYLRKELRDQVRKMHKYHFAFRKILENFEKSKILPVYTNNFIKMSKQFSTIGINGFVEACEFLGFKINVNDSYMSFTSEIFKVFSEENTAAKDQYHCKFNTEIIPAENLGVKNAKWDHEDDYYTKRKCYNSYLYIVEDDKLNIVEKFVLHGRRTTENLDGGSAAHINLEEHLTPIQYYQLMCIAAKTGCPYWTTNVLTTICNDCEHHDKATHKTCPKCGSSNVDYGTRIIGYFKRIKFYSKERKEETSKRFKHPKCL